MTSICSRRAIAPLLGNLVLLGALAGCGSGDDSVPSTLSVSTSSLPSGQVGSSYSGALAATGGTAPYHWTLASGTLPPGLALSASGTIAGTPSAAVNSVAIDVQVTDSGSPAQSGARSLTLTIAPAVLSVATSSLPQGQIGVNYSAALAATGGTPPYHWALASGALPAGLTLAASGTIAGTPSAAADAAPIALKVTDSGSPAQSSARTLSLTIAPTALAVTTTSLPPGDVGVAYAATLSASGGTPPYRWSIKTGALAAGLSLSGSGSISGTPSATSAAPVSFELQDSSVPVLTQTVTLALTVNAALAATTTSLPTGEVGVAYAATLSANGGTPPYRWSIKTGALAAGLSLSGNGSISGTPTATSAAPVTFELQDSSVPVLTQTVTLPLTVNAALVATTTSLPTGEVGVAYAATLAASGGTPPYQWSVKTGALAAGLSLSGSGSISGAPTATSAAPITFELQDSSAPVLTQTVTLPLTVNAGLAVTTTSLPVAQVGKAYTATLAATGGTPPLNWSISAGSLPAGLALTPSSGMIAGTPTTAVNSAPLTVKVTDSNVPAQQKSVNLALSVASSSISIAITPRAAALTLGQTATLSVSTNDPSGVTWSLTPAGGSFAPVQSVNGTSTTFTAPSTAGSYTITATSVTNPTVSSTVALGVTDLAGVFTHRNDTSRDGVNAQEYALTAGSGGTGGSVAPASFGKLFSCIADGAVYAQPLWAANLTINGAVHNVVFVASAHDSLFAFDADANPCMQLWSVSLIDTAHGATAGGEVTVPAGASGYLVGGGSGDITPEVGVIGTPVIDAASGTLYVVSKSMDPSGTYFYQRLHAIDVTTGLEKASSPILIQGTYPGTGDKTTTTTFSARYENQRTGLALINGSVYVAWAAHEDVPPPGGNYYGWLMGYTYGSSGFTQVSVLNVTPNVGYGGIWMGGGAPSVDANGHVYVITGNGGFDATNASGPINDYGDSLLQLSVAPNPTTPSAAFTVSQYFTPGDQAVDESADHDFGAGGAAVLANVTSGTGTVGVVVGGGKDGTLYILNQASLGGYSLTDADAWQKIATGYLIFSTVAMWNDTIYLGPFNGPLTSYALQTATTPSSFVLQAQATDPAKFGFPGPSPAISATGTTNGIVWALDNSQYCTKQSKGCGPAVLHAYDATSLAELWNSSMAAGGADAAGNAVKFTVPSVANGKVYVGTRGNNTGGVLGSTSVAGELDVYGLQPN